MFHTTFLIWNNSENLFFAKTIFYAKMCAYHMKNLCHWEVIMKLMHLSDLHIGKRVNEFSMLEEQRYILKEIVKIADVEKPQAVLISGDVYDKPVPPAEAVAVFDDFLVRLAKLDLQVFVISGNHDSPNRLAFGGRLMHKSGVHLSPVYQKEITPITLQDNYGTVCIYMLPFIKPIHVRVCFPDADIVTYTDAVCHAIKQMDIDTTKRNVLLTHQFVIGSERSESEEVSVGGTDGVSADVFDDFDYVALGHIHKPQCVKRETLRYCGTPLKYSFSECRHKKSVTMVHMAQKGNIHIDTIPLIPKRDMKEIRGTYLELTAKSYYQALCLEDYYHITLTDEEDIPDVLQKLRVIYPNIMKLDYDNQRTKNNQNISFCDDVEKLTPLELIATFYEMQNNQPLSDVQKDFLQNLVEEIWEGEQ